MNLIGASFIVSPGVNGPDQSPKASISILIGKSCILYTGLAHALVAKFASKYDNAVYGNSET